MARSLDVASRFRAAYFALAAVLGTGVGLFVLAVEKPAPKPPPPWSAWQPAATTPTEQQVEIADYVGARYHLPNGQQLVNVLVGPPTAAASDPITEVALAKTLTPTQQSDILGIESGSSTAMYILCGDQSVKCAIKAGKPSIARGEVLRREALELALYTFRYVKEAKSVVTFFPPQLGQSPTVAMLFTKTALSPELSHPLRSTLPAKPPVPGKLLPSEQRTVDGLTRFFKYSLQRDQTGGLVLVLAPDTA